MGAWLLVGAAGCVGRVATSGPCGTEECATPVATPDGTPSAVGADAAAPASGSAGSVPGQVSDAGAGVQPSGGGPPASPSDSAVDRFGVRMLYPSAEDGMTWESRWDSLRSFAGEDPLDPWFDADHGEGSFEVGTPGELWVSGRAPRMYVRDPAGEREWRDVEITLYAQRVADEGIAHAGIVSVARSHHNAMTGAEGVRCDSRGLGARLRYDGTADFEKETVHPTAAARGGRPVFQGGLPHAEWLGVKHVVFDRADGAVVQQLWLDRAGGADGGAWELVNETVDDGRGWGSVACRDGVDPALPLRARGPRDGSETGRPNLVVYFRSDGVAEHGLRYRWASVREIDAARAP